jgi:hypothetical protein
MVKNKNKIKRPVGRPRKYPPKPENNKKGGRKNLN